MAEKLEKLGCDPIEGLARIAMDSQTAPELKVRCYAELAQYVHSKSKAVEQISEEDQTINVFVERAAA